MDERKRADVTPEEEARLIAERKRAEAEEEARLKRLEAEADLVDEKLKLALYGGGSVGVVGLIITLVAGVWRENVTMMLAGAGVALVGFGVITAAQYLKIRGGE